MYRAWLPPAAAAALLFVVCLTEIFASDKQVAGAADLTLVLVVPSIRKLSDNNICWRQPASPLTTDLTQNGHQQDLFLLQLKTSSVQRKPIQMILVFKYQCFRLLTKI